MFLSAHRMYDVFIKVLIILKEKLSIYKTLNRAFVQMQFLDVHLLLICKFVNFVKQREVWCILYFTWPLVGVQIFNDWSSFVMLSYIIRSVARLANACLLDAGNKLQCTALV